MVIFSIWKVCVLGFGQQSAARIVSCLPRPLPPNFIIYSCRRFISTPPLFEITIRCFKTSDCSLQLWKHNQCALKKPAVVVAS